MTLRDHVVVCMPWCHAHRCLAGLYIRLAWWGPCQFDPFFGCGTKHLKKNPFIGSYVGEHANLDIYRMPEKCPREGLKALVALLYFNVLSLLDSFVGNFVLVFLGVVSFGFPGYFVIFRSLRSGFRGCWC